MDYKNDKHRDAPVQGSANSSAPGVVYDRRRKTAKDSEGYFNRQFAARALSVFAGTHRCSDDEKVMLVTTLGSCISVCIHDPVTRFGGMNHFMLPDAPKTDLAHSADSNSMRYGLAAMEILINDLMCRGVRKENMIIKIFGGANVIKSMTGIGTANTKFVKAFLANEGYRVAAEDTGGQAGRRIHFFPATGKVMRRFLKRTDDLGWISSDETKYITSIKERPVEGDIQLFLD